jgi:uncharacterized delta-60 repeat protein
MLRTTRLLLTLLMLAATGRALAAPGDLDLTFNGTGKVTTEVPTGASEGTAVVRQADGKIVVAGAALAPVVGNLQNVDFAVVRYDATGMLDSTFGGDGIVTTPILSADIGNAVIQQSDGKLVVAGLSYNRDFTASSISLVRYLNNGDPDPGFGVGGKVVTNVGGYANALALIQQQDDKLVVAGNSDADIVVVRYDTSGTPDGTFGGVDGIVTTTVGGSAKAWALLEQASDHKLVVAGGSDGEIVLVRYGTDGTPDATFNGTGIVTTTVPSSQAEARGIVQQASDGKLVVAGFSNPNTGPSAFMLARYDLDGNLDMANFGTNGIVTQPLGPGGSGASGLTQQADGKLVAAGFSTGLHQEFALVRFDATGSPDAAFGTDGVVLTGFGAGDAEANAIIYQPDGFLVAAGSSTISTTAIAAARYVGIEGLVTTTTTSTTTTSTTTTSLIPDTTTTTSTTIPTTTSSTTTMAGTTTTSTTLPVQVLFPGGPSTKPDSDCYLELLVENATASQIQESKLLVCKDGDPCDTGPAGDDRCDIRVAGCVNQTDPALPTCTAPAALQSAKIKSKVSVSVPSLLSGPQCTPFVTVPVKVKRKKNGKVVTGKSKVVLNGEAKAPKDTSPRKDVDKWTIQCLPSS